MRIALFDYQVVSSNPIGGCHLRLLRALASEHEFTVFSVQFDNPWPERITWVRVPVPRRPLPLLFIAYHIVAPVIYAFHRLRTKQTFDAVQTVESKLSFGDIVYTHFCHTSYLKNHWLNTNSKGLRGFSRWLDHRLHASLESRIYQRAKKVLVPSKGLANEVTAQFPVTDTKLSVLPNAVDVEALDAPKSFDRTAFRKGLGIEPGDITFIFAALGHFERKGLPLLLSALSQHKQNAVKLIVVGGSKDLVDAYKLRAEAAELHNHVVFVGMHSDIRPYLWAADAFLFASSYETFSLVAFESAAASLPLITPLLYGLEEIVRDGETGYVVERTVAAFVAAIHQFVKLTPEQRAQMGRRARAASLNYGEKRFVENWRRFYAAWPADNTQIDSPLSPVSTPEGEIFTCDR